MWIEEDNWTVHPIGIPQLCALPKIGSNSYYTIVGLKIARIAERVEKLVKIDSNQNRF
jgi:hypothetical protein